MASRRLVVRAVLRLLRSLALLKCLERLDVCLCGFERFLLALASGFKAFDDVGEVHFVVLSGLLLESVLARAV